MSGLRLTLLAIATSSITALPSLALADSSYVYCSNGIVCMMAPCPSGNALDLATGRIIKGVSLNATELPPLDRSAPDLSDKLHAGKLVVRGSIQHRDPNDPPMLVATNIERASRKAERKRCAAR